MDLIDLTGQRFGMLTVLERVNDRITPNGNRHPMWRCRCDCGNECIADGGSLRRGQTKTCGCWKKPKPVHGMSWVKAPAPLTVQDRLIIGETYTIHGERLKCIGLYNGFARFENADGFHECYHYFDLERIIK